MFDFDDLPDDAAAGAAGDGDGGASTSPPLLVCFYSGGMLAAQGRGQLRAFLAAAAAAGFEDALVLDHATEDAYAACEDFEAYVGKMAEQVTPSRSVVIFAHSHGCLAAYGLARRLGESVRKLYVVGRRPPTVALLDEVWGVSSGREVATLSDNDLLEGLVGAWRNPFMADFRGEAHHPVCAKVLSTVRAQYSTPCAPGGSADLASAVGGDTENAARIAAPIKAFACSKELPKGETAAKMESWRELTASDFEMATVEADHMDCMANSSLFDLVLTDMRKLL